MKTASKKTVYIIPTMMRSLIDIDHHVEFVEHELHFLVNSRNRNLTNALNEFVKEFPQDWKLTWRKEIRKPFPVIIFSRNN